MVERGSIVWAKIKHSPWWPAVVLNPEDCGRDKVAKNKFWVFWFGDHLIGQVAETDIMDFKSNFKKKFSSTLGTRFKLSVQEVLTILATHDSVEYCDPSLLFDWAQKGFCANLKAQSVKTNADELPDIVIKSLNKSIGRCSKKTKAEHNEISKMLNDVKKGDKSLEDVCLFCCKSKNSVVGKHPLFIGGICNKCPNNIIKILNYPKGETNIICVVCGRGGNLIHCSNNECKSSYCETCVGYLTPKETFSKIGKDDLWKCYLCEPIIDIECLIKKREIFVSQSESQTPKSSMRVLALSEAALPILKKKGFSVDLYAVEPSNKPSSSKPDLYYDFNKEELLKIRANFVYGSYFYSSAVVNEKKKMDLFWTAFYRFFSRLSNAKDTTDGVFFMFLCEEKILNADDKARVKRFLTLDPVIVKTPKKWLCLWSNVPDINNIKNGNMFVRVRKLVGEEEEVLGVVFEPLRKIFQLEH